MNLPAAVALPDGLLWGCTVRPPQAGWDGRRYRGPTLAGSRRTAVQSQAGVVAVVQQGQFLGVVATSALYARQAAADLAPVWHLPAGSPDSPNDRPHDRPDPGAADAAQADYRWALHAAPADTGAPVAVWCLHGQVGVWMPACTPAVADGLRLELSHLLAVAPQDVRFAELPGAAGPAAGLRLVDTLADAALLSQAVGRPVALALQAHPDDHRPLVLRTLPASARTALVPRHAAAAPPGLPPLQADAPWAVRPSIARLLSQPVAVALAQASAVADGPILHSGLDTALTGADADALDAAQVFAQESLWFEQALAHGEDPLAWRLRHLPEGAGAALARRVIDRAGPPTAAPRPATADGRLRGRGFATARTETTDDDGRPEIRWSAWMAEVAVDPATGRMEVLRVVAGQAGESPSAPTAADADRTLAGDDPLLLADTRQLFARAAAFDDWTGPGTAPADAGAAGQNLAGRADTGVGPAGGRLRTDGGLALPAAAAIANAIHDATGVRLRQVPFDPERLRLQLAGAPGPRPAGRLRRGAAWLALGAAGAAALAATAWPARPALPLTDGPDLSVFSAQAVERGRRVAAAGDCVVCHTAPGGAAHAGGLGLPTPFGTVYSTNITPDPATGIGRWSLAAFERAMRHGIHQDGRRLYPVFPYTAFARLSDGDIQALYAYLMSQPATVRPPTPTRLAFPFNLRPALAGWNLLFHDATPFRADPARTAEWNRGAYLVEGAGHCSACHSPRNALGAEKSDRRNHLAGGEAEGWTAPALNDLAGGPTPWTRDTLRQYLRTGFSPRHGVAGGPMAPVVQGLAALPQADIDAMATYLLDLPGRPPAASGGTAAAAAGPATTANPKTAATTATATTAAAVAGADAPGESAPTALRHLSGERIYQNACAVCHEAGSGPTLFGVRPDLAANTNLRSATPDNLVRTILHGIRNPAHGDLGYMPGFQDSLDDAQIHDLVAYLRQRFAPDEKPWSGGAENIRRLRGPAHP
ncbi:c-type cytochrome [Xylophilus sp. Kf1]|nr:c-type cytochrome [Xylophilus sp. Kf1]